MILILKKWIIIFCLYYIFNISYIYISYVLISISKVHHHLHQLIACLLHLLVVHHLSLIHLEPQLDCRYIRCMKDLLHLILLVVQRNMLHGPSATSWHNLRAVRRAQKKIPLLISCSKCIFCSVCDHSCKFVRFKWAIAS